MKKYILSIIFSLLIIVQMPISFADSNTDILTKIENSIFGFDYTNDNKSNRISRLEKAVYGKISGGDINKRIKKLSDDTSADVIGLETEPCEDTFLAEEKAKEESTVNYPVVDKIEQKLFNRTYKNRDFHTRIVTIEKKLFGKIYDVDDYETRMNRIKTEVLPEELAYNETLDYADNSYSNQDSNFDTGRFMSNRKFKMPFGQKNYTRPYANYGDYGNFSSTDDYNEQLSQMEYDTFGTEFSNDSTQNRLKRLNSVNKAKKSSRKYDSQKFSQHMSTAMEIGAMILMILAMVL